MKENELLKVKTAIEEEKVKKNETTHKKTSSYSKQWKFRDSALGATVSQTTSGK